MKKSLILAALLAFAAVPVLAADNAVTTAETQNPAVETAAPQKMEHKKMTEEMAKRRAEFEKRLKLTDEQKAKAKEIRQKGHEEMKPIFDKMQQKHQEIEAVKKSRIAVQDQEAKIAQLKKEIRALKIHAHELQMKNMQEFQAILTKKQLKELKKMKEEGRKKFDEEFKKHHPQGPGFRPFPPEAGRGPRPPFNPDEPAPVEK